MAPKGLAYFDFYFNQLLTVDSLAKLKKFSLSLTAQLALNFKNTFLKFGYKEPSVIPTFE